MKNFIADLLNRSLTDRDLQKVWFESSAEVYFPDANDLRGFLAMIRDALN